MDAELSNRRLRIELDEDWDHWRNNAELTMSLPIGWMITVVPPYMGAMVRFYIKTPNRNYSVYFDTLDRLGIMGKPYFEVLLPSGPERCDTAQQCIDIIREYESDEPKQIY